MLNSRDCVARQRWRCEGVICSRAGRREGVFHVISRIPATEATASAFSVGPDTKASAARGVDESLAVRELSARTTRCTRQRNKSAASVRERRQSVMAQKPGISHDKDQPGSALAGGVLGGVIINGDGFSSGVRLETST